MARTTAGLLMMSVVSLAARQQKSKPAEDLFSEYDGLALLSLKPCDASVIRDLNEALAELECKNLMEDRSPEEVGCADERAFCPHAAAKTILAEFKDVDMVSPDAGAFFRETSHSPKKFDKNAMRTTSDAFFNKFRGLDDVNEAIDDAVSAAGEICQMETIGQTWEGRDVRAIRVRGSGWTSGMPRVIMSFGIHAREWVSHMSGVYFVQNFLNKVKQDASFLDGVEVMLVPLLNPDGFAFATTQDRFWRKNRNQNGRYSRCKGVDLNRNFPKFFGGPYGASKSKCSEAYMGTNALSEPEAAAIATIIDEAPVSVFIDVHTYGRVILKPWSGSWDTLPNDDEINELGNKMLTAMKKIRNNYLRYGGNELLGAASGALQDYSNGGIGYTFEMSTAFDPNPSEILPSAKEVFNGGMAAIEWAKAKR